MEHSGWKKPVLASILGIILLPMERIGAFTVSGLGWRDLPCSAEYVSHQLVSSGTLLALNSTYAVRCQDNVTYNQSHSTQVAEGTVVNGGMKYVPKGPYNLTFVPTAVHFNASNNNFTFTKTGNSAVRSDLYPNNATVQTWWQNKGAAYLPDDQRERWLHWQPALDAVQDYRKYNSTLFSVERIFSREYPALPFDNSNPVIEETSAYTPRAMMKITSLDRPEYFATLFCFPGRGDNDFFNKPLLVGDAFDPEDGRGASVIRHHTQYRRLLAVGGSDVSPRNSGHDLFFLDFSQGGGNLHLNAMLYLKALEWLSSRTNGKVIAGGISMGGIVARLALLYSMPGNNDQAADLGKAVKGYLSVDAPHQGANMSAHYLRQLYSLLNDWAVQNWGPKGMLRRNRDNVNSPAAHQMLKEHYYNDASTSNSTAHNAFYGFLTSLGGYRPDIPKISIAYSNLYRAHAGFIGPWEWGVANIGKDDVYRTVRGNYQEYRPGSTGYWYWSPLERSVMEDVNPSYFGNPPEMFKGTFISFVSALDLKGFDDENPPTSDPNSIRSYSPFDEVHYMQEEYNGYCDPNRNCNQNSLCENNGNCLKSIEDRRYEHMVFDKQLMRAIATSLHSLESLQFRKRLASSKTLLLK